MGCWQDGDGVNPNGKDRAISYNFYADSDNTIGLCFYNCLNTPNAKNKPNSFPNTFYVGLNNG